MLLGEDALAGGHGGDDETAGWIVGLVQNHVLKKAGSHRILNQIMKEIMTNEQERVIKQMVGYVPVAKSCLTCNAFVECDASGNHAAEGEHCTRNAFHLPVAECGSCDYWEAKQEPQKPVDRKVVATLKVRASRFV